MSYDDTATDDEFNNAMDDLYDWADLNNVWIA